MSSRLASIVTVATLAASASALAQTPTDLTFTASGTRCQDVNWSSQTLARYPHIAEACQGVVQRDGKYFVVFAGTVARVTPGGHAVTVNFKDGDHVTLNPPPNLKFDIAGVMTRARDVEPGQELTFYVPQDRFVAEVPEGEQVSAPIAITQWEPQHLAYAAHATMGPRPAELPQTGTELGLLGLGGLALMLTGAGATAMRYRRSTR